MRVRWLVWTVVSIGLSVLAFSSAPRRAVHAERLQTQVHQAADPSSPVWIRTGGPIGGIGYDIRSRSDNPDYLLVTDVNSGLNISIDNGITWTPSNTGMDTAFVFSATIDPNDNDIVWAGTQTRMGIFKSTDGGRTWARKSSGVTGDVGVSFRGFTVDPTDSTIVYAAGEISSSAWNNGVPLTMNGMDLAKGMVYKTVDGGEHWTLIWSGDSCARYVWIDPRDTKVLYVSTGIFDRAAANANAATNDFGGVGILKSTDGGQTWSVLNKANGLGNLYVSSLFMHPTDPDTLVAGTGGGDLIGSGVYLTTDGGASWTRTLFDLMGDGTARANPFTAIEISLLSPDIVYAAGVCGFFRSADRGRTWTRHIYPGSEAFPFWGPPGMKSGVPIDLEADRRDPMRVFANMYQGGNLLTTDGGKTWANASRGYTGAMMRSVAIDPGDPATAYAAADSGLFKSNNGGQDWLGLNSPEVNFPGNMVTVAVSPSNGQHLLVSDEFIGSLYRSVDGGQTWEFLLVTTPTAPSAPNPDTELQGFASIAFAPSDTRTVYAGLAMRVCYPFAPPSQGCNYPTRKGVHRSTDGGRTWQIPAGDGLGLQSILALAVHPQNPDIVYAGTGAPGLFKSENGGLSWASITNGIVSIPVRSIAIDPSSPTTVYLGTGGAAVFKSTDGGASWLSSSAGLLPTSFIRALLVDPTNPSILWAGVQGIGAYRSLDAGVTWTKISDGFRVSDPQVMSISDDGGTLYAGTWGDGVYRLDLPVAPRVRAHPAGVTVAAGAQASFSARASGNATPTVQWQVSRTSGVTWADLGGAMATTYTVAASTTDDGTRYRAVFSNALGSAASQAATLTVTGGSSPPTFQDDPLQRGVTPVMAIHLVQLRHRIDELRARHGLSAMTWTDDPLVAGATTAKAMHVAELRAALAAVYTAASRELPSFTEPLLAGGGTLISATHIAELRAAVLAIW